MSRLNYEKAQKELDEILVSLESQSIGIEELNKKLKRAAELIKFCRQKLRETESSVDEIMNELRAEE